MYQLIGFFLNLIWTAQFVNTTTPDPVSGVSRQVNVEEVCGLLIQYLQEQMHTITRNISYTHACIY